MILVLEEHSIIFLSSEVLDSLISFEMIFDKVNLTLVVNPLESVRAESVHESVSIWRASVREKNGDLVKSLWGVRPEIEDGVWITQVG